MSGLSAWLVSVFGVLNYGRILLLMIIESSFIPFPSELVIPPAAFLAQQGQFNIILVVFFGTLGSLIGALINYYLAKKLGRPIVNSLAKTKIAKLLLISPTKIEHAEKYFLRYGKISTFIGRLVPAIRQLISIPAGLAEMKLKDFVIYTTLGALLWNSILAWIGYLIGSNQELLSKNYKCLFAGGTILFIGFIFYLIFKKNISKRK